MAKSKNVESGKLLEITREIVDLTNLEALGYPGAGGWKRCIQLFTSLPVYYNASNDIRDVESSSIFVVVVVS